MSLRISRANNSLSRLLTSFKSLFVRYTNINEQSVKQMDNNSGFSSDVISNNLLPMITNTNDRSMELFRQIMIHGDNSERDFKEMVEEFLRLIETKLSDTEKQVFDTNIIRSNSPSLFDMLNDLKTCLTLLRRAEIQSLLNVFDNVLKLNCYVSALPEHEESTRLVQIEKNDQPLGLTISRNDIGEIHITRLIVGGLAVTTQLFQINDRILEINHQPITGQSLDSICSLMSNTIGSCEFLLSSPANPNSTSYQTFHVRALFDYDPLKDPLIPCKELGFAFQRGDILRVVARDDNLSKSNWWQAYRENLTESSTDLSLAGLIPSENFQEKRRDLFPIHSEETNTLTLPAPSKKSNTLCFTCRSSKHGGKAFPLGFYNASFLTRRNANETSTIRTSTHHFSLSDTRQFDDEICARTIPRSSEKTLDSSIDRNSFYEPVFRLNASNEKIIRPIILLGASNVGRHELRRRLLQTDSHLFELAIPHTTRERRLEETPDVDYHFVSEADFLAQVACHAFIEFGQYDRHLYGTSIDDIRDIGQSKGKICILNLNPDALKNFDQTDLYPFIIFINAPSIDRLKRLTLDRREYLTEKDYRDILRQSQSIERNYRHRFDEILINDDLDQTYFQLKDLINKLQHHPQQWIRTSYRR